MGEEGEGVGTRGQCRLYGDVWERAVWERAVGEEGEGVGTRGQ